MTTDALSSYTQPIGTEAGIRLANLLNSNARPFHDRVAAHCGSALQQRPTGEHEDPDGMAVEPFLLHDNLMLAGGVVTSGGCLVTGTVPLAERYTSLAVFERCVERAAVALRG